MRLLRNSLYTLIGSGLPLIVTIVTLPLLVSAIGLERYGGLAIAWLILGYFLHADFGFGRAVTQRVASIDASDIQSRATTVWTGTATLTGLSLILAGALYLLSRWYFTGAFEASDDVRQELIGSVWMLAVSLPLLGLAGVMSGALMGTERFGLVAASTLISNTSMQVFPLIVALTISSDLRWLIAAALFARAIGLLVLIVPVIRLFFTQAKLRFEWTEARYLAKFGAWIFVTVILGQLILYLDRLTIGVVSGATAAAIYAIPYQIASRSLLVPYALSQAIFPRLASEEEEASVVKAREATLLNLLVFTPIAAALICLAEPLLSLWLGDNLDPRSIAVAQIIMVGCWFNATGSIAFSRLQARGDARFPALLHAAELPVYIALLFALGTQFGLAGFAAAFGLRCLIDSAAILARARVLDRATASRMALLFQFPLIAGAVVWFTNDWIILIAAATLLGLTACGAMLVMMPAMARQAIKSQDWWQRAPVLRKLL